MLRHLTHNFFGRLGERRSICLPGFNELLLKYSLQPTTQSGSSPTPSIIRRASLITAHLGELRPTRELWDIRIVLPPLFPTGHYNYKWKNHFFKMKGGFRDGLKHQKGRNKGSLHSTVAQSYMTPSLYLCSIFTLLINNKTKI